jgi:malate dehydrogenase
MKSAPKINPLNFHAMTRLDQNRAVGLLAKKAEVSVDEVSHMTIWGNHSLTQVPDFYNAKIGKQQVTKVIKDEEWLKGEFIKTVQQRGAEIIAKRGKSSAASAAHAAVDAMKAIAIPTKEGQWFSSAILSDNNPYEVEDGLIFSFPCITNKEGVIEIVKDLDVNEFLRQKIILTEKELKEERELIKDLI